MVMRPVSRSAMRPPEKVGDEAVNSTIEPLSEGAAIGADTVVPDAATVLSGYVPSVGAVFVVMEIIVLTDVTAPSLSSTCRITVLFPNRALQAAEICAVTTPLVLTMFEKIMPEGA